METTVIAIVSSESLYRLAWLINQQVELNLSEAEQIKIMHQQRKEIHSFFVFSHTDKEQKLRYSLIQNKSEHGPLVPSLKQIDYFFRIDSETSLATSEVMAKLKQIREIQLLQIVDAKNLKKGESIFSINLFYNIKDGFGPF